MALVLGKRDVSGLSLEKIYAECIEELDVIPLTA
jgi:hypothetical protein